MTEALDQIMAIMECAFDPDYGEAWNRRQVSDALVLRNTHVLLANSKGGIVSGDEEAAGFALSRGAADEEELLLIAVRPQDRGRGVGRALLSEFIRSAHSRGARKLFLEMRDGNPAAKLYRQFDFREVGRRREYYNGGRKGPFDALTMAYNSN